MLRAFQFVICFDRHLCDGPDHQLGLIERYVAARHAVRLLHTASFENCSIIV